MPPGIKIPMINLPAARVADTSVDTAAPGLATDISASVAPGSAAEGVKVEAGHEDLTVFFAIGMVINVLMVTAYLIWAVRQWRKKK